MTNTFKLIKAEFVKIFKRPSIFIMAIILVVSIFASISMFSPSTRTDYTIEYENTTNSQQYYNNFYDESSIVSKLSIDNKFVETDQIIAYYQALNTNTTLLTDYYNSVISTMNKMINENHPTTRETYRPELIKHLNNFKNACLSLDSLSQFEDIIKIPTSSTEYELYADEVNYLVDAVVPVTKFLNSYANNSEINSKDLVNYYTNNNYYQQFTHTLNSSINFIYTTFKGLSTSFALFQSSYDKYLDQGKTNLSSANKERSNMLKVLTTYKTYYNNLINKDYPVILVKEDTHKAIIDKLDEAISYLDISVNSQNNLPTHNEINNNLYKSNISIFLTKLTEEINPTSLSNIVQSSVSDSVIGQLNEIKGKVNSNRTFILDKIEEKRIDESIVNISKEATNYQLLSSAYNDIIIQKILYNLTEDYAKSTYSKFHGYDFDKFNKYQATESITLNSYYIDNNTYENSYLNNFSYNQNTGFKTNMYDFVYFTMEICTLIITIYAMMLICNLITAETESGTIKLLLVRPYRRSKIITAKLIATIFFVVTFMLFSSLITFIGGYFLYGSVSTPVLAVFNSYTAFEISPLLLMIINIITLILEIIFFVAIALMVSIICKNFAASISCSLVLLIMNFAFNALFGGAFWYTLLPGMNLHLFKYFGNTFITANTSGSISSLIQTLLITGIDTSMSIWFSIIISGVYFLVFLAVSYAVFQKRDF